MLFVSGRTHYGAVDEVDDACVATLFLFFQGLPIYPLGTYAVFRREPRARFSSLRVQRDWRSMAFGYGRVWGLAALVLGGLWACLVIIDPHGSFGSFGSASVDVVVATVAPLLLLAGYAAIARGTPAARRGLLRAYFAASGLPVDPARLVGVAREQLATDMRRTLEARCSTVLREDYRAATGAGRPWAAVALDPTTTDLRLLAEAITLARLEASLAAGADLAAKTELHDKLWQRLRELDPSIVTTPSSVRGWRPLAGAIVGIGGALIIALAHVLHFAVVHEHPALAPVPLSPSATRVR